MHMASFEHGYERQACVYRAPRFQRGAWERGNTVGCRASHSVENTRLQHPCIKFNLYLLLQFHLAALSTMESSIIIEWSSTRISDLDHVDINHGLLHPRDCFLGSTNDFLYTWCHMPVITSVLQVLWRKYTLYSHVLLVYTCSETFLGNYDIILLLTVKLHK